MATITTGQISPKIRNYPMKKLLLLCLLPAVLFSQGVRRESLIRVQVTGTYAAAQIVGDMFSLTAPDVKKGTTGYIPQLVATTDTINAANSVRLFFFNDTAGFGIKNSGTAFVLTDTMAAALRGTTLLNFGVTGASGNSYTEVIEFKSYNIPPGKRLYCLGVAEAACKFKWLTGGGKIRYSFAFDDYYK